EIVNSDAATTTAPVAAPTNTKESVSRRRKESGSVAGEPVPDTADRRDVAGSLGVVTELRPEAVDRHVDQPGVAEVVVAPDSLQEGFPAEDAVGVAGQFEEQPELGGRQVEDPPVLAGPEGGAVDLEVADPDGRAGVLGRRPAQRRPQPGHELRPVERLRHE